MTADYTAGKWLAAFCCSFLAWAVVWPLGNLGILAALALATVLAVQVLRRQWRKAIRRRAERRTIVARAEAENQLFLAGDPRGLHGQYMPEDMG